MYMYICIYINYSLASIICPPLFCHPQLIAMVFHLHKFNFHYILYNFTLFYLPPSLSANIFSSPKGGG